MFPSTSPNHRRVLPSAAAAEDVAGSEAPFRRESVRVPADRSIVVANGITVEHKVVAGEDRSAVAAGDVNAGVTSPQADALLDSIVVADDSNGIVAGIGDYKAVHVPVGAGNRKEVRAAGLARAIEERVLTGYARIRIGCARLPLRASVSFADTG